MDKPKTKQQIKAKKKKLKVKKRLVFLVFVLFMTVSFLLYTLFLPEFLFGIGKAKFEEKDYKTSSEMFRNAYRLKPESREYPYYLALSLSHDKLNFSAQKDLYEISQSDSNLKAALYAAKVLSYFRNEIMSRLGDSYIQQAIHDDQVLRWNLNYLPLKYYVDKSVQVPPYYLELIQKSFLDWQSVTDGLVRFAPVNNKNDAQIIFTFIDVDNSQCKDSNCEYSVGNTVPVTEDNILKYMDVKINIKNNLGKFFSPAEIYTVMIHEIGHSLGIWGHSDNLNDIMFYSADQKYSIEGVKSISKRDLNTLRLLYALAPDITNIPLDSAQKEYFWYAPVFLNGLGKSKDFSIKESAQELNANPNDVSNWLELADKYASDKQYEKGIAVLTKALEVVRDAQTVAVIYYNMASDYLNLKKYPQALDCAYRAQQINNDFDTRALIALIKSNNGQYRTAEKEFIALRAEQPGNIDVALDLTDLYIVKKEYMKARKTIKSLIKANPSAANDPELNNYKIYMAF